MHLFANPCELFKLKFILIQVYAIELNLKLLADVEIAEMSCGPPMIT